jgi:ATPase subunit of ABC transporter with duplicated ATPase domains
VEKPQRSERTGNNEKPERPFQAFSQEPMGWRLLMADATATSDVPVMQVEGLSKSFGPVEVLREIGLSFQAGKVHAIIGENGAGI